MRHVKLDLYHIDEITVREFFYLRSKNRGHIKSNEHKNMLVNNLGFGSIKSINEY
jgi:hypothetical protein